MVMGGGLDPQTIDSGIGHFASRRVCAFTCVMKLPLLATAISVGLLGVYITAPPAAAVLTDCAGPDTEYTISSQSELRVLATDARCRASDLTFTLAGSILLDSPWTPIGTLASPFRGTFVGNGNTIGGLSIPLASDYSGLFGHTDGAMIEGINLSAVNVNGGVGVSYLGALVGYARDTEIRDVSVSGSVGSITTFQSAGGVVGRAQLSELSDVTSTVNVRLHPFLGSQGGGIAGSASDSNFVNAESAGTVDGFQFLGGLVGLFDVGRIGTSIGTFQIENCTSQADVTGAPSNSDSYGVGGLIGRVDAQADGSEETFAVRIVGSTASGDVSAFALVGGLIGSLIVDVDRFTSGVSISMTVTDSSASGNVAGSSDVGGFFGGASGSGLRPSGAISGNSATGSVTGIDNTGGFSGIVSGLDMANSHATGSVTATGIQTGGFVGHLERDALLEDTYAIGAVTGTGSVGGHVGYVIGGTISNSYATGNVSAPNASDVGGFAGVIGTSSISHSLATGMVTGNTSVGGFAGSVSGDWFANATLSDISATGSVTALGVGSGINGSAGGLIGVQLSSSSLVRGFSTGNVTGRQRVGGLVGDISGFTFSTGVSVSDSYATGGVTGETYIGALVGNSAFLVSLTRSYATGHITATSGGQYIGGVAGIDYATTPDEKIEALSVYWDTQTTGIASAAGTSDNVGEGITGTSGLTSAQMRSSTNFAGWDFTSVWGFQCGVSATPELRWANPSATQTAAGPCPRPGPAPTPETSSSASAAVSTPVNTPPALSSLSPGATGAQIDGQPVEVSTERGARGAGLTLRASPLKFTLRGETASGQRVPLAPNGSLILPRTGEVPISGDGLEPNSTVVVTLFSDPVSLGSAPVGADGRFKVSPVIPVTVPLGAHTLELSGRTKTGEPFVLSVGVLVETPAAALGADPVVSVRPAALKPGASVAVTARGVQAGCWIAFAVASERAQARASTKGVAQSRITLPQRLPKTVVLRATVSGPECSAVSVSKDIPSRPPAAKKAVSR